MLCKINQSSLIKTQLIISIKNAVESVQNDNQSRAIEMRSSNLQPIKIKKTLFENKLPPLIDEEQAMNMFNDAEGLMRSTKYKEHSNYLIDLSQLIRNRSDWWRQKRILALFNLHSKTTMPH